MNDWKHRADHQRKDRNHLGTACDRPSPGGIHQAQDGRDQGAGMADADPENKIRDIKCPIDRPFDAGDRQTVGHLIQPGSKSGHDNDAEDGDRPVEPPGSVEYRPQEIVVDLIFFFQSHYYWLRPIGLAFAPLMMTAPGGT